MQHAGQSWITVGNHLPFWSLSSWNVSQSLNNVTQGWQRSIDGITFLESFPCGGSLLLLFRSSQIDNVDHGLQSTLFAFEVGDLGELDLDDGVRTGRCSVHLRSSNSSISFSLVNYGLNLFIVWNWSLCGTFNIDVCFCLFDWQRAFAFGRSHEQVLDLVEVNFDHGDRDFKPDILFRVFTNSLEQFTCGHRNDTFILAVAKDRIRLARACLTIRKESTIETLPGFVEHSGTQFVPNFLLICVVASWVRHRVSNGVVGESVVGPKGVVKGELAWFFLASQIVDCNFLVSHFDAQLLVLFCFLCVERSHSNCNVNCFCHFVYCLTFWIVLCGSGFVS